MIYFDNSTTSYPKPKSVATSVFNAINNIGSPNRSTHELSINASKLLYHTRKSIATLFHLENPLNIAFTSNATESLNLVISSVIKKEDHVITTLTEHNSTLRPLYKKKCSISFLPCDNLGNVDLTSLNYFLNEKTKAIICNHGSNVTGNVLNIKIVSDFCKKNNLIFILDCSQTAGIIDIDGKIADFLCFTGHKSLFGPQGTGGIISNRNAKPIKVGGLGERTFAKTHSNTSPSCFEAGTHNCHSLAGLNEGVKFILDNDINKIYKKDYELSMYFYNMIKDIDKIKIYGDFTKKIRTPIVSISFDGNSSDLSLYLNENYNILTRSGFHCAPLIHKHFKSNIYGICRFSFSYFNTYDEIKLCVDAIKKFFY